MKKNIIIAAVIVVFLAGSYFVLSVYRDRVSGLLTGAKPITSTPAGIVSGFQQADSSINTEDAKDEGAEISESDSTEAGDSSTTDAAIQTNQSDLTEDDIKKDATSSEPAIENADKKPAETLKDKNTALKDKAADFKLTDINGKTVSLSGFKGKNVFLYFWTTWSGPCNSEMQYIEKMYQKYKDKNFEVITVNLGENKQLIQNYIKNKKYSINVLMDEKEEVANRYNISTMPTSYFIDKNGYVLYKKAGVMTEKEMESKIALFKMK